MTNIHFRYIAINPYDDNISSLPAVNSQNLISSPHVSPEQPPDLLGSIISNYYFIKLNF